MPTPTGTPSLFGGIGKLEWAPTNGPDDLSPAWDDLTVYVETEGSPLAITRGRQSEFDLIEAAQLSCVLRNPDSRFTYGYTAGPYGANWSPAKQIRYSETIGERTFVLFTGNILFPDITDWQPIGMQYVQLSALDRMARLARGRKLISTLSEYIKFSGSPDLKGYWPMTDAGEPFNGVGPFTQALTALRGTTGPFGTPATLKFQSGLAPTGGENSGARIITAASHAGDLASSYIQLMLPSAFTPAVGTTDKITVCFWWSFGPTMANNASDAQQLVSFFSPGSTVILSRSITTGVLTLSCSGAMSGTITGGNLGIGALTPIGVALDEPNARMELWIGSVRLSTNLTGAPFGAGTFGWNGMGYGLDYDISHLQVYVGTTFNYTQFLSLIDVGANSLAYQTTGQRINTLLDWAGVARYGRSIDAGVTNMQAAAVAGQDPLTAIQDAANTEWGRFFMDGNNRPVFHDRAHFYNV